MTNMIENNNFDLINRFVNTVLKNKKFLRHSDIDVCLNMSIKSLLNYDCILNEEDNQYINQHFSNNFKYAKVVNDLKLKTLYEAKRKSSFILSEDKKKLMNFQLPQFEVYFVAKLYVNGMPIEPEYTTELVFSSQISQKISMRYKYKDLTPDSFITISVYSMQLPQERYLLGSTTISIFDDNFNLVQGRHVFKLYPKVIADYRSNSETNGRSTDPIDKEIDLLIFTYHEKSNNVSSKQTDVTQVAEVENMTSEEILNAYIYSSEKSSIILKNDYLRNYESKLDFLLTKTKNSFIEIEFQSFDNPVIYDEQKNSSYRKCFKCLKLKNREPIKNWICDPKLKKGKDGKDFLSKDNPMTEKFSLLSRISDDAFARDIRPSPYESSRINELLNTPDFIKLEDHDIILFWKYRYDLLKSNKKYSLTKILNSVKWGDSKSENEVIKNILYNWSNVEICDILFMLSAKFNVNEIYMSKKDTSDGMNEVRKYAANQLNKISDEELNFILLQLVQALRYENQKESPLRNILKERCSKSTVLASSFYWFLNVESDEKQLTKTDNIDIIRKFQEIKTEFFEYLDKNGEIYSDLQSQINLDKTLIDISAELSKVSKGERKLAKLRELLSNDDTFKTKMNNETYSLPLDPRIKIKGTKSENCNVFKSAKFPVKYRFNVTPETRHHVKKEDNIIFETMFKYGDDLRQDQLVLQIFSYMDMLLKKVHLDYEFTTYKVLATSKTNGFVEFVSKSNTIFDILKSKSQIRAFLEENAKGDKDEIQKQLSSFINSCAGYCVVTYLLGIGDRHLENLLIDKKGRLFHIDFGFILGKDPKPYPPPMKLCKQMVDCMGGNESKSYEEFKTKCVNAYWVLRDNARLIVNMFYLMIDAGIPELNNTEILNKLHDKFVPNFSRQEASNSLLNKLEESVNAFSQVVVDTIHSWAQYWK